MEEIGIDIVRSPTSVDMEEILVELDMTPVPEESDEEDYDQPFVTVTEVEG